MEIRGLLQNRGFVSALIVFGVFTTLFLASNLLVLGGDSFFNISNTILAPVTAVQASFLLFQASRIPKDHLSRPIWSMMGWGFGLWSLAEIMWAFYALILQQEIPYPSIADLLWLVGYLPLYAALVGRLKTLKLFPTRRQQWQMIGLNSIWIVLTAFFVVMPVLQDFELARLAEGIVNMIYPLADAVLLVFVSLILVLLREGRFSLVWRVIFGGMFLMTASDLLYAYGSWNGLYYPDGVVNGLTNLVDTSYILSYIIIAFGIVVYRFTSDINEDFAIQMETLASPQYDTFVATNRANQVITAADNFHLLVNGSPQIDYANRKLDEVLGVHPRWIQEMVDRLVEEGPLINEPCTIKTYDHVERRVWLTAVGIFNPDQEYAGANVALSAEIHVEEGLRLPKNQELRAMMNYLLTLAGSRPEEEVQNLRDYFLEVIRLLSALLYQFGGSNYRRALFEELDRTVKERGLPLQIASHVIQIPVTQDTSSLAGALLPLLEVARLFVIDVVGETVVSQEIQELEGQLTAEIQHDLDKYNLRSYAV